MSHAAAASDGVPFWGSFWPALTSTAVGVVLGVPIALWLNRLFQTEARRSEDAKRREAFARTVHALRESITWNGEKASSLKEAISRGDVPFEIPLEVARWEAVRAEFVRLARNAELQGRVAFFFDGVGRAARMADRRFEFVIGPSATTDWADEVDVALRGQLLEDLPAITAEAHALDGLLLEIEADTSK